MTLLPYTTLFRSMYMQAGSAGELGRQRGLEQVGFWRKLVEHPAYDSFWQQQAMDKLLAKEPLKVPVMLVHSLWDQEEDRKSTRLNSRHLGMSYARCAL